MLQHSAPVSNTILFKNCPRCSAKIVLSKDYLKRILQYVVPVSDTIPLQATENKDEW